MFTFKKHHTLLLVLAVVFAIAWSIWTWVLLPKSETPNLPDPAATTQPSKPLP